MNNWRRQTFLLLLFIASFSKAFPNDEAIFNGWAHLELGAGNYGSDGHTKSSQAMTVLKKIENVTSKRTYIDDLEEVGRGDYKSEDQYGILFWTLEQLVDRYGSVGVFHVNDLYEEYSAFATQKLLEYTAAKGYNSIIVESIPGDYQLIDSEQNLSKYGKVKYTSVHLKNPEVSFFHDQMDGDHFFASEKSRGNARSMLKNLADLSTDGLYLFILYHDSFVPVEEKIEFMEKDNFYHPTDLWEAVPYIFPEGNIIDKEIGRVFHIDG